MNVANPKGVGMDGIDMDFFIRCGQSSISLGQNGRLQMRESTTGLQKKMSNYLSELARTSIVRQKCYEEGDVVSGLKRSRTTFSSKSDAHIDRLTQCVKILQEFDPPC